MLAYGDIALEVEGKEFMAIDGDIGKYIFVVEIKQH